MKTVYATKLGRTRLAIADLCEYPDGSWVLTRINVPTEFRGRGYGSELLEQITDDADYEDIVLRLEVSSYGQLDNDALADWYNRHGFEMMPSGDMVRQPNADVSSLR